MRDFTSDELTAITVAIVVAVSLAILIIRDRWRNQVGMPKGERKRLEKSASRWGTVFMFGFFGIVALVEFVLQFQTPERTKWGLGALMLFSVAFRSWVNGRRRRKDDA